MTVVPLQGLRAGRDSHRSALWWLALLYRDPKSFRQSLERLPRRRAIAAGAFLWLHGLPYVLILGLLGRMVLFGIFGMELRPLGVAEAGLLSHLNWLGRGILAGFAAGLTVGTAVGIAFGVAAGSAASTANGIAVSITACSGGGIAGGTIASIFAGLLVGFAAGTATAILFGVVRGIHRRRAVWVAIGFVFGIAASAFAGLAVGLAAGLAFATVFGISRDTVRGVAVAIGAGLSGLDLLGAAGGLALGISTLIFWSRVYYHPGHVFFLWPYPRGYRYPWHPVAWDHLCTLPFPDLNRLLVDYGERSPRAGRREIARLLDSYPSQRREALRARTILLARDAARVTDLARLDEVIAGLPEGEKGFLGETRRLRGMVHEIAALQAQLHAIDRPFLRKPLAQLLAKEIENFQHRISGFHEPLVSEFRAAAERWAARAETQLAAGTAVPAQEPVSQIFRAGDPVDRSDEAFVPRDAVLGELERQVLLTGGCPGLLLYGRRRMGKSTILRNLPGFLPTRVKQVQVSMQDPWAFTSLGSLLGHLGGKIRHAVENLQIDQPPPQSLEELFRFLTQVNEQLQARDLRLVMALDEYENIDRKIGEGVFPEDLLATLRESIQSHRRITWIFAGSHEITRLENAPWTSYLVSTRTIEVPPFSPAETRLLLTEPLKYSRLWVPDDPARPRFASEFWGDGGIERIHSEAGGWPHLVQLIAEAVVDMLNDENRGRADSEQLERAFDLAVVRGHTVLYELLRRESTLKGEWEYLSGFRVKARQPPPHDEDLAHSLQYRLMVAEDGDMWRLRVPLMERWLRQRG